MCLQVELCEALRRSVAVLQREREALREEQRLHRALGARLETLVQERLEANEQDKYSVFIGEVEDEFAPVPPPPARLQL